MRNPEKRGFFITGTDTGVGKTWVAVALTRALVELGLKTAVMKPVAAGAMQTPEGARNDDALELLAASNVHAAYEDVNPWLLATAASPHLAARHDGVTIGYEKIALAHHKLAAQSDLVLVEGAGGWLAPISATATMADVAERLGLPVILVVGMRLGCLNHALLTREAIRSCGLTFAGWIANRMPTEMALARPNIDSLAGRFGMSPLGIVPSGGAVQTDDRRVRRGNREPAPTWAIEVAKKLVSP
jgi:dethiobiotin synthetase